MFRWFPLCILLLGSSYAQELPPIKNYAPSDYEAENQNWGISQSLDKLIYAANNKGLLEFNGAKWTFFPSPNETIIRSVKVVGDRIYTGCYKEFGYWQKNKLGTLDYHSLSDKFKEDLLEDEEFWNIAEADGWILFQSKKRIYIYDLGKDQVSKISSESSLPRIFKVDQEIYFQRSNEGLFKIQAGRPVLVNDEQPLIDDEIINIFQNQRSLLILTRHQGFYKIEQGLLQKWYTDNEQLLLDNSIYSAIRLKNQNFALGTISNGFILLDDNGALLYHIDQINGLQNNTVLSLFEDIDDNVWLGLDNGISLINLNSPFRVYNDNRGAIGSVYAAEVWEGNLYLGTNQGLFYKPFKGAGEFKMIEGTQGQVWSLNHFDGTLFCGHHTGTYVVIGNRVKKIANIPGTWKLGRIEGKKDLLLQGNYNGLYVLNKKGKEWTVRNKVNDFDYSSRYFEVFGTEVFVNHEYRGVFKITVDSDFSRALKVKLDSLTPGFNSGIVRYNEVLLYAHKNGVLRYDPKEQGFFNDSVLSGAYSKDSYVSGKMVSDEENNRLWFFSKENLSSVSQGKLANTLEISNVSLDENLRNGVIGYESISPLDDGKVLLGTSIGYMILDQNASIRPDFEVRIGSVSQSSKDQPWHLENRLDKTRKGEFKHDQNSLGISFYTPYYDKYATMDYQFQLKGIYPSWSDWAENASVTFENLPYGDYTFNVRSRIGGKASRNIATYSFTINKPWHLSNGAIVLYIFLGILGSLLIHNAYKKYYHNRQQKLIEKNRHEMELTKAQNEKEIIKIKNEQLQKEFRSKSNELAASTLSIIRKNELLTKVKQELSSNGDSEDFVKPIINIIDKNLNQNDDWELFKEAFNNADRKFLKKLKKAHPKLSPNDIRLCAYLRLNLSSKEIAPLLNISPRSVEIKRYRLRKKMNLSHDDNLTNYILKL